MAKISWRIVVAFISVFLSSCQMTHQNHRWSSTDSLRIIQEILAHRAEVDSIFCYDPASPFQQDTMIRYHGIRWFPPDVDFYFQSKLFKYDHPETVIVLGTKGEERKHVKYGYFLLEFRTKHYRLNVYKFTPSDTKRYTLYKDYLNVWCTDRTTGKETYEVGRYIDVGAEKAEAEFLYSINFNNAYNPYCAYSSLYSCAIPRKEDYVDVEIRAGEMKYHHGEHQ